MPAGERGMKARGKLIKCILGVVGQEYGGDYQLKWIDEVFSFLVDECYREYK